MSMVKRVGFTLIEMLVVIVIILILAGLLMPAITKAKEAGRATRCGSNLRQLQMATINFSTDNGRFPSVRSYSQFEIDEDQNSFWRHIAGWVAWNNFFSGHTQPAEHTTGTYNWYGAGGYNSITNGSLWGYIKEKDVYRCPTFALRSTCGRTDAFRSYSMNTNASYVYLGSTNSATALVLFGDDQFITNSPFDGTFYTNQVGRWHGGNKGMVVYADGRVERQ